MDVWALSDSSHFQKYISKDITCIYINNVYPSCMMGSSSIQSGLYWLAPDEPCGFGPLLDDQSHANSDYHQGNRCHHYS